MADKESVMIDLPQDIFATKGLEYLLVICYLFALVPLWLLMQRSGRARKLRAAGGSGQSPAWFDVPEGYFFHPTHQWAYPVAAESFRVGLDDLAHHLVGPVEQVHLPTVGSALEAGDVAARIELNGQWVDLFSPISGRVSGVNPAWSNQAETSAYGDAWLYQLDVDDSRKVRRNLMTDQQARVWMSQAETELRRLSRGELGETLQDGGRIVHGFARQIAPEDWLALVRSVLSNKS